MSAKIGPVLDIHDAAKKGDVARLEELLRSGVPVDTHDRHGLTPLGWAATSRRPACVKLLLEAYADYNHVERNGTTPLHRAAVVNDPDSVLLLLKAGANIEATDTSGRTPLSSAVIGISYRPIELLLDRGARLTNRLSPERRSPWFRHLLTKRENCQNAVFALYKVLRKRYRPRGTRIPKDMVKMLANYVRQTQRNRAWQFCPE